MKLWLSPKIKYKTFKKLDKALYPNIDIIPVKGDKILWQLLRERKLNMYIEMDKDDPLEITLKNIPVKAKIIK